MHSSQYIAEPSTHTVIHEQMQLLASAHEIAPTALTTNNVTEETKDVAALNRKLQENLAHAYEIIKEQDKMLQASLAKKLEKRLFHIFDLPR